jgi:hypothetical protein
MIAMQVVQVPNYLIKLNPTKQELRDTALDIRSYMLERTKSGKDVNGRPFQKYSPAYREHKAKQMTFRGDASRVNLMFTGEMHRSVSVKSSEKQSEIYYANANRGEIAYHHQVGEGVPQREHFGVSEKDQRRFLEALGKIVFKRVNREWTK